MMNIQEVQIILRKMAEIFRNGQMLDWANVFDLLQNDMTIDPVKASLKILSMYGGVGSINDLVLYKEGKPMIKENDELDFLRIKLHALCREYI